MPHKHYTVKSTGLRTLIPIIIVFLLSRLLFRLPVPVDRRVDTRLPEICNVAAPHCAVDSAANHGLAGAANIDIGICPADFDLFCCGAVRRSPVPDTLTVSAVNVTAPVAR